MLEVRPEIASSRQIQVYIDYLSSMKYKRVKLIKDFAQKEVLATVFACLFCNHEKSVSVKIDRKMGVGSLNCKVCGQSFQCAVNCAFVPHLSVSATTPETSSIKRAIHVNLSNTNFVKTKQSFVAATDTDICVRSVCGRGCLL